MKSRGNKPYYRFLLGLLGLFLLPSLQAAPLNLVVGYPDVFGDGMLVNYDATTGTMTVNSKDTFGGFDSLGFNLDGSAQEAFWGDYTLTANFDTGTGALLGGTLTIDIAGFDGGIAQLEADLGLAAGSTAGTNLLTADLDLFGFSGSDGTGVLEYSITSTSGWLAGYWPSGGVILNPFDITTGAPTGSWTLANLLLAGNWDGSGKNNTYVPLPATFWLFMTGLAGLVGTAQRRRRSAR